MADTDNELLKHTSVYRLAMLWKVSGRLLDVVLQHYQTEADGEWDPHDFLRSLDPIFEPLLLQDSQLESCQVDQLNSLVQHTPSMTGLQADKLALLAVSYLHQRRRSFKYAASTELYKKLQNNDAFLSLFVRQWPF